MQKLKTKLIAFSLAITIPSIAIVSIVSLMSAQTMLKDMALTSVSRKTQESAYRIESMMMEYQTDILTLPNTPSVAEVKKFYQQIRFLYKGKEIVRMDFKDGNAVEIPLEKLQDKSGVQYYEEVTRLSRGEIYISSLTLNREEGRIC